jgi:hypothetical protein
MAEVLDEKTPGGVVNDRARAQSHLIAVAYDHSMATEVLDENTSVRRLAAANDGGELAGSSEVDQYTHELKTEPIEDFAYPTVQGTHYISVPHYSSVPRALVDTVAAERLLLDEKSPYTCTLIATYRSGDAVGKVCELITNLLQDGEADVSAIDVGGTCFPKPGKPCPPRRLNIHAPSDSAERSVQAIDVTPPMTTPAPGYIVFTAIGFDLSCEQIATRLNATSGVITVSADVGGIIELGSVSDKSVLCHLDFLADFSYQLLPQLSIYCHFMEYVCSLLSYTSLHCLRLILSRRKIFKLRVTRGAFSTVAFKIKSRQTGA